MIKFRSKALWCNIPAVTMFSNKKPVKDCGLFVALVLPNDGISFPQKGDILEMAFICHREVKKKLMI